MKVVFTIDSLAQGGTEQSIAELIAHFNQNIEIIVVYFYDSHQLRETYESLNCKLVYLGISDKYGFYKSVKLFYSLVMSEKPDVVVSSLYRSLIISRFVCWWTKIPLVGTFVNERYGSDRKERFKGLDIVKYFATWFLDRITAFIPIKVISNSYSISVLNGQALGINSNRIKVIYRGRSSAKFEIISDEEIIALKSKLKLKNSVKVLLNVSRLLDRKGQLDLLHSYAEVLKSHQDTVLILQERAVIELPLKAL